MRLDLSAIAKNARSSAFLALLAGGSITIYSEIAPAAGGAETTALLIYTLPDPAGTTTSGVLTATTPLLGVGLADGTASWGRVKNSSGAWLMDADAGAPGADAFFILDSTAVTVAAPVSLLSLTFTEP